MNRFLSTIYPHMHMKLYEAICESQNFQSEFPEIIDELIKNPKTCRQKLRLKATEKTGTLVANAFNILAILSEKENTNILIQLKDGLLKLIINEPIGAVVLQATISDRWSNKYGTSTIDLILALPELGKVITISATEAEIPTDPLLPRLSKVSLENAHLFIFFNRAHAVRGRRIIFTEKSGNACAANSPEQYGAIMRTCSDIETIGKGMRLSAFTPVYTADGLRLAFFFTLMCRVNSVEWVRSPTGFGSILDEVDLVLNDFSGCLKSRMSTAVFSESFSNSDQNKGLLEDPTDLSNINRDILVVGAWILGNNYPQIISLGIPQNNIKLILWGLQSFMNSRRKMSYKQLLGIFPESIIKEACEVTKCILRIKDLVFYKEESWPKEIFLSMEENNFPNNLTFSNSLKFGASFQTFKAWSEIILPFLRVNTHILQLYRSKDSDSFRKMYSVQKEITLPPALMVEEKRKITQPANRKESQHMSRLKCPSCGRNTVIRECVICRRILC